MPVFVVMVNAFVTNGGLALMPTVELSGLYQQSWAFVDFFLLFALFAGTARATVGHRLEGREGQLISLALGAILAIAALGFEVAMGINLTALGPIAAVVFLVLVGAALLLTLKKLGMKTTTAGAVGLLVLGFGISAVSPTAAEAFGWLVTLFQLGAIAGIGLLAFKALSKLGKLRPGGRLSTLAREVKGADSTVVGRRGSKNGESLEREINREKVAIGSQLRPVTKKEEKDSSRILRELKLIQRIVQKGNLSAKDRRFIAGAMSRVPPQRHALRVHLERVQRIDQALLRFDAKAFTELRQRLRGLNQSQQRALKRLLLAERRKIGIERRIGQVENFVKTYDANAAQSLERAGEFLVKGDAKQAGQWVVAAVRYEEEAEKMIERVRAVERMLMRLTKTELRQVRKAA